MQFVKINYKKMNLNLNKLAECDNPVEFLLDALDETRNNKVFATVLNSLKGNQNL